MQVPNAVTFERRKRFIDQNVAQTLQKILPSRAASAGSSSNAKPAPSVAVRMPKDLLSSTDTRNFLHWVPINSSEKPFNDA
jgi:hypothetical protein